MCTVSHCDTWPFLRHQWQCKCSLTLHRFLLKSFAHSFCCSFSCITLMIITTFDGCTHKLWWQQLDDSSSPSYPGGRTTTCWSVFHLTGKRGCLKKKVYECLLNKYTSCVQSYIMKRCKLVPIQMIMPECAVCIWVHFRVILVNCSALTHRALMFTANLHLC